MVTSDFRPEVEIQPIRACAMHPTIIGKQFVHCGRGYGADVPQNVFLVYPRSTFIRLSLYFR